MPQEGHTLTDMYSKLVDATQALQEKQGEVDRLKFDLSQACACDYHTRVMSAQILQHLEQKAPMIHKLRDERDKAELAKQTLIAKLESATKAHPIQDPIIN